jgi:SAM-dependent methyltransferase
MYMNASKAPNVDVYLDEYTRQDIIARYISQTAGAGIAYVLNHVYAPVYLRVIQSIFAERPKAQPLRILEYGCGGGMNLLKLIELVQSQGAQVERAYGTDFSAPMIEAARKEAAQHLPPELNGKLEYVVARNEVLASELASGAGVGPRELEGTFDLVVGVNTFRYCHRLKKENDCAKDISNLLRPGGYSVMIDMNRYFPFFRSKARDVLTRPKHEYYIPSLKEYARPFREVGFVVQETRNFCWIPHSAKAGLLALCRAMTPVLDACCSPLAMRSLVIAQKPHESGG